MRYRNCLRKIFYDFQFALRLTSAKAIKDDEIIVNGKNLFDVYINLYSEAEKLLFTRFLKEAMVLPKCDPIFRRYIYQWICRNGHYREQLSIKTDKVRAAARQVGKVMLGDGRYEIVRGWLDDEESKNLFDLEILQQALRLAGWYPEVASKCINTGLTMADMERVYAKAKAMKTYPKGFADRRGLLALIFGFHVDDEVAFMLLQDPYQYKDICTMHHGDIFFDCGACCGETAIMAMEKVGGVVSFEPIRAQADIARENIRRYQKLRKCQAIVENIGVGDRNNDMFIDDAWASSYISYRGSTTTKIMRIDDWCQEHNVFPDYIKMDIEGSELSALRGAELIIRKRKPRLAISVYHKPGADLWEIPKFIKDALPSYHLYLKKTNPFFEACLFAVADC